MDYNHPEIILPGNAGTVILDVTTGKVSAKGKVSRADLARVQMLFDEEIANYSPAYGYPGYRDCREIARKLGGKPHMAPPPPIDPDVMY